MSNKPEQKIPTYSCYNVNIPPYVPESENAVRISFLESPGGVRVFPPISFEKARQLEKSLSDPTHTETPPFASPSGDMVNIFWDEETRPTFQMTLEGAADFQKKLSEAFRSFYEFRKRRGLK